MDNELVRWVVTLATPKGPAVLEVPSTLGPDAAGRRAVVIGCHQGWGDLDTITVTDVIRED